MKMNIQIEEERGPFRGNQEIVEIDINRGNWKYWDNHQEGNDKVSLTLNNVRKSHYLSKPVKDVYPFYDHDLYKEEGKVIVKEAMVRTYDSLLDYLNCRIENSKEEYRKYGWTKRVYHIILFDESIIVDSDDVTENVNYDEYELVKVTIKVVE